MRILRRSLAPAVTVIALGITTLIAPGAAHAGGGPNGVVVGADGTICWEKGNQRAYVVVRLNQVLKDPFTVVVDTFDGTATAPADYTAISGLVVTIPSGSLSVQVPLQIVADDVTEPDEWFFVSLSKPSTGQTDKVPATVTIKDGAQPPA